MPLAAKCDLLSATRKKQSDLLSATPKFGCSYHYHHHRHLVQFSRESNLQVPREPLKTLHRPTSSQIQT